IRVEPLIDTCTVTGILAIPAPPADVRVPLIWTGCARWYADLSVFTVIASAGGSGGGVPAPEREIKVGEVAALLVTVTVAVEEIVPRGAYVTRKEVPEGGTTSGRDGKFPSVKKAPAMLMEFTVREPAPVGVMVKAFWDEVVTG